MVLEARRMVDAAGEKSTDSVSDLPLVQALNAMGYEEAAEHVYGTTVGEWKKRHQKKATDEQMENYNASKSLHASHDKDMLALRADKPTQPLLAKAIQSSTSATETSSGGSKPLLSNVCCQDVDEITPPAPPPAPDAKKTRVLAPFEPPPIPNLKSPTTVAILTVSDRAFKNEYETGDLSGPAVAAAIEQATKSLTISFAIIPDDTVAIQSKLKEWTDQGIDLILTTGGTGMSPRDVTPEATRAVLDLECAGLMSFVTTECSHQQPLASLSRGTAGIRGQTLIANLPGNPKGVGEVVPILLPLLLHAVLDLQAAQ
jgi:molybdopterin adenylyltransferase